MKAVVWGAVALVLAAWAGTGAATAEVLKNEAAVNAIIGKKIVSQDGWSVKYAKGGKATFTKGSWFDRGKWWINDDGLVCAKWKKIRNGATACTDNTLDGNTWSWVHRTGPAKGETGTATIEE